MLTVVVPFIISMLDDWLGPLKTSNPANDGGVKRSALPFTAKVISKRSPRLTSVLLAVAVNFKSWASRVLVQHSKSSNMEYLNFIVVLSCRGCGRVVNVVRVKI